MLGPRHGRQGVWAASRVLRPGEAGRPRARGPGLPSRRAPETGVEHCPHPSQGGTSAPLSLLTCLGPDQGEESQRDSPPRSGFSPPSSARLPMPVFGEQNCQDRESGRIRGFGAEQQGGGGFAGSVCVSSEEGVERMTVCLWMSARARAEMRASCGVERSCIWGDVQRAYRPYSTV